MCVQIEHQEAIANINEILKVDLPATVETLGRVIGSGCRYIYNHLPRILGAGARGFLVRPDGEVNHRSSAVLMA